MYFCMIIINFLKYPHAEYLCLLRIQFTGKAVIF
jgi:hypothetical protein